MPRLQITLQENVEVMYKKKIKKKSYYYNYFFKKNISQKKNYFQKKNPNNNKILMHNYIVVTKFKENRLTFVAVIARKRQHTTILAN